MTVLEVPDPRLRLVAEPVETVDDSIRTLVADMIETMYDFNGIGLAATQVGVQKRVLVIDLQEEKDEEDKPIKNPKAYINAEILSVSDEVSTYNEGCLSIPEQYAEVARPARRMRRISTGCYRPACSMRSTISTGCCSSTISAA